jgi:hypothetical protein
MTQPAFDNVLAAAKAGDETSAIVLASRIKWFPEGYDAVLMHSIAEHHMLYFNIVTIVKRRYRVICDDHGEFVRSIVIGERNEPNLWRDIVDRGINIGLIAFVKFNLVEATKCANVLGERGADKMVFEVLTRVKGFRDTHVKWSNRAMSNTKRSMWDAYINKTTLPELVNDAMNRNYTHLVRVCSHYDWKHVLKAAVKTGRLDIISMMLKDEMCPNAKVTHEQLMFGKSVGLDDVLDCPEMMEAMLMLGRLDVWRPAETHPLKRAIEADPTGLAAAVVVRAGCVFRGYLACMMEARVDPNRVAEHADIGEIIGAGRHELLAGRPVPAAIWSNAIDSVRSDFALLASDMGISPV